MTTQSELAEVSAALHDEYFHLSRLEVRADRDEARLPIFPAHWKKRLLGWSTRAPQEPLPPPVGVLVVRNVVDVHVEDEANIGWYGVNGLEYDSAAGVLRIVANTPCQIVLQCRDLDVELLRGSQY